MKPLRLIDKDEPSRQQIAMAAIEQSHREWSKQGWHPFDEPRKRPALDTDDVLRRAAFVPTVEPRKSLWRRLVERVRGL